MQGIRILITGAASGIGLALARRAADAGARLVLLDRDGIEAAAIPVGSGPRPLIECIDLRDTASFAGLADRIQGELGGLDAIVHAAAVIVRRPSLADVTEEDFDLQYEVNLRGTFFLVTRLQRLLGRGSSIVLLTSQGWWTGGLGGSLPYAATKAGVVALTRGLARELAAEGIRVNAVAPGFVDTAMMRDGLTAERREELVAGIPLGRMATPEEIADAALLLLQPGAAYMTGATLNVTGGQLVY